MAVSFGNSVKANSAKILQQTNAQVYKIASYCFVLAVLNSPSPENPGDFAKGVLVNQWYPVDGPQFSSELGEATSPGGSASLTRIGSVISPASGTQFLNKDGSVTLANNVPYGILAEKYGWQPPNWSGRVGPYQMIALAIQATLAKYQ